MRTSALRIFRAFGFGRRQVLRRVGRALRRQRQQALLALRLGALAEDAGGKALVEDLLGFSRLALLQRELRGLAVVVGGIERLRRQAQPIDVERQAIGKAGLRFDAPQQVGPVFVLRVVRHQPLERLHIGTAVAALGGDVGEQLQPVFRRRTPGLFRRLDVVQRLARRGLQVAGLVVRLDHQAAHRRVAGIGL